MSFVKRFKKSLDSPFFKKVYSPYKYFHTPLVDENDKRPTCPYCGHPLVQEGKKQLESLGEHVEDPNGTPSYKNVGLCKNPDCAYGVFNIWNYDSGEQYYSDFYFKYFYKINSLGKSTFDKSKERIWSELNKYFSAAGNSFELKNCISISKWGQLEHIYLSPFFTLLFYMPYIEFFYTADERGNILSKKWKIKFLSWSDHFRGYNTVLVPWYKMLIHSFKIKKNSFKKIKRKQNIFVFNEKTIDKIFDEKSIVNKCENNKKSDTYRYWSSIMMRILFPVSYIKYKSKNKML